MHTVIKFTCPRKVKIVINFQKYLLVISILIFAFDIMKYCVFFLQKTTFYNKYLIFL